jgi:hypothetical protein
MTLSKLIGVVSDTDTKIYDAFFKAKIFASRLGNWELLSWIEKEINGYHLGNDSVPEYRMVRPNYQCTLTNMHGFFTEKAPLPTSWFEGNLKSQYFNYKVQVTKGIVSLEHSLSSNADDFTIRLSADLDLIIDNESRAKSQGSKIRDVVILVSDAEIKQLLATIRNKLLDLLLSVEREFPNLKEVSSTPSHQKELINQTIHISMAKDSKTNISGTNITTSGSGNNVNANVGTGNTINSANVSATSQAIADFVATVRSEMEKHEFPAKAALAQQLDVLEEEAQKPEPKSSVLNTGLDVVNGLLLSVAANAWTEPILNTLISLKAMIGG